MGDSSFRCHPHIPSHPSVSPERNTRLTPLESSLSFLASRLPRRQSPSSPHTQRCFSSLHILARNSLILSQSSFSPIFSQDSASRRTLRMSAVKRRRHSLNSKYDRLLKPSHSPATNSHPSILTPSLIPDKSRVQASGARVRRDRQRNRQRLWDDLGFGPEAEPSEPVLTESTLVCKMVSHVTPHHPC